MKYRCPLCEGKGHFPFAEDTVHNCQFCHGTGTFELVPVPEPCEHVWAQTSISCPDGIEGCLVYHFGMVCTKCGARKDRHE